MNIFDILHEPIKLSGKIRIFEAFSGVGCQLMALKRITSNYECVGFSEIDKYAIKSYRAIHGDDIKAYGDITKMKEIPECDIFTWSFPCTDLSKAGKQAGMTSGTRSGLVYEVLRLVRDSQHKPKVLIMENVIDLIQVKFVRQFGEIQLELERMGYMNYVEVLNAKDHGVAQNRERVFMVSILGDYSYSFPRMEKLEKRLKDYLEDNVDEKYYLSERQVEQITNWNAQQNPIENAKTRDDETLQTITAKSNTSMNASMLLIKEATQKGYALAEDGDGVYINRPHQKRGVVQKGMIQMLKSSGQDVGVVVENITQKVSVREFNVDIEKLKTTLRKHKNKTNKEISTILNIPITLVEHWFRNDNSFAIPSKELWHELKKLLNIQTNEFDLSITSFIEKDNEYEKSNRVYHSHGILPTLTSTTANEKIKHDLRIRKLTPLECWRLMDISDDDFYKAKHSGVSDSQLYKQAGNGIVVRVFEKILREMIK